MRAHVQGVDINVRRALAGIVFLDGHGGGLRQPHPDHRAVYGGRLLREHPVIEIRIRGLHGDSVARSELEISIDGLRCMPLPGVAGLDRLEGSVLHRGNGRELRPRRHVVRSPGQALSFLCEHHLQLLILVPDLQDLAVFGRNYFQM